jgi:hypothetical protein
MPEIFGHKLSTPALTAIVGGSGLAIWFAWKQHKSASSASNSSAIDPVTGLPYSQDDQIDPLTGMGYLAEAQEYGSVSAAEQAFAAEQSSALTTAGDSGFGDISGSGTGTTTEVANGGYATNAAWAQAVTAGLTDLGYTATDVSAALGMYLGGLPLTTLADGVASSAIVEAAIAEYGPPPVGTFQIILPGAGSTGSGSGGTGTGTGTGTGFPISPPPITPITPPTAPSPEHPLDQVGTVHSNTTGENAPVKTTDGGFIWTYTGESGTPKQSATQTGTVHSTTTNLNAEVKSTDGGFTWTYTGVPTSN